MRYSREEKLKRFINAYCPRIPVEERVTDMFIKWCADCSFYQQGKCTHTKHPDNFTGRKEVFLESN